MLLTCVSCRSLGAALGFTVNILEVWSSNGGSSRARASVRTLISFISEDGGKLVPSEDVTQFKRSQKHEQDSDKESFDMERNAEGHTNKSLNGAEASEQTREQENAAEDGGTDGDSVRFKANAQWKNEERDGEESRTTL
ncbi:hypothetical protein JOQ06_022041 [Pogonophryne albipinna]|uniref:Uncharacterized protein n=1 Tax=Pogonophryne albipinna TaxID=1090488 RepID=A0AAD6F5Y4_9TELE|nr:hypothetical protein JOQ06_022041 [Pogonophryne albipinna]